ncbi:Acylphosphatase-like domain-containing protein [Kockovaella imperatae]|uniref:acylphosphatase n=1 Tax=Kockovaella imperatae TaxID=4999 RepID=A0A1Y1UP01_9TREE|nr:Acylphosphatase-like domain-containing protein [Kockovaella imperatae]ORX39763.1 Acylphosphatase-like domain-containing protein [Kockovaella imperatae]
MLLHHQGVFFRQTTQKEANKLGLRGWCHNHPDSSVEGMAAGPTEKIREFQAYLKKGPSQAQVTGVEIISAQSNVSEEEVRRALGSDKAGYEVRHYRG